MVGKKEIPKSLHAGSPAALDSRLPTTAQSTLLGPGLAKPAEVVCKSDDLVSNKTKGWDSDEAFH